MGKVNVSPYFGSVVMGKVNVTPYFGGVLFRITVINVK